MLLRPTLTVTVMNRPNDEWGFTLIELMIALTIGLLLVLVVTQAYVSGVSTQRTQSDMGRLQESARFAFDTLSHGLRKAGYKNPQAPGAGFCDSAPPFRLVGRNDAAALDPTSENLSGSTITILNSSDVVRTRYYGEGAPITPFAADGTILDCLGNSVKANTLVEDTYFVAADATNGNEPALFCYTNNVAPSTVTPTATTVVPLNPAPIIPEVESLQTLYGEDLDGNGIIDRYVPAGTVTNMNNVRSIMLSVVTRTPSSVATDRTTAMVFNHFGTAYAPASGASYTAPAGDSGSVFSPAADGRIRQQSSTTVALRNVCPM